jgi:hypothetical protein
MNADQRFQDFEQGFPKRKFFALRDSGPPETGIFFTHWNAVDLLV